MVELSGPVDSLGKFLTLGIIVDTRGRVLYHVHADTLAGRTEFNEYASSFRKEEEEPGSTCFICDRGVKRYDKVLRVANGDTISVYDASDLKPFTSYTLE